MEAIKNECIVAMIFDYDYYNEKNVISMDLMWLKVNRLCQYFTNKHAHYVFGIYYLKHFKQDRINSVSIRITYVMYF